MYLSVLHVNLSGDHVSSDLIEPIRVVLSVERLTQEPMSRARYVVRLHTSVSTSADSRGAIVIYWRKNVRMVVDNSLEGLSLPRNRVIGLN